MSDPNLDTPEEDLGSPWVALLIGAAGALAPVLIMPGAYEDTAWFWIWLPWGAGLLGGVALGRYIWRRYWRGDRSTVGGKVGIGAVSVGSLTVILRNVAPDLAVALLAALGGCFGATFLVVGWKMLRRR